jgi:hypothetical protein
MIERINVRLEQETADFLSREAARLGVSKQAYLHEMLVERMKKSESREEKLTQIWNDNGRIITMLEMLINAKTVAKDATSEIEILRQILVANGTMMSIKKDECAAENRTDYFLSKVSETKEKVDQLFKK